jgi:hypothetical protein
MGRLARLKHLVWLVALAAALTFAGCSSSSEDPSSAPSSSPAVGRRFTVSGTLDGLSEQDGSTVTLFNNGGSPIVVAADGVFSFPRELADNALYVVSVLARGRRHVCAVERGLGRITGHDVTDVLVHCPSTDATLAALSVDGATLSPPFDPATHTYRATLARFALGAAPITVTATARSASARLLVAGAAATSGAPSAPLTPAARPAPIDVRVTAADGRTEAHYTIVPVPALDYLKASNTRQGAQFGISVALSGDTLAVGSSGESSGAVGVNGSQAATSMNSAGAVYVFRRSGAVWAQEAYIKASNTRAGAQFGVSVALSGDTLAVGSYGESSHATGVNGDPTDTSAYSSGAAYVFTRAGTTWSQQAYLKPSTTRIYTYFGISVALDGDTLGVGAYGESSKATGVNGDQADASMSYAGAAYVFQRTGGAWAQEAYLKASNTRTSAQFGVSIALSKDTLAVGSSAESSGATGVNGDQADTSAYYSGAVYVFSRAAGSWSQQAYVKASNARQYAGFGGSVALSGETLAVGSYGESSGATGVNGDQTDGGLSSAGAAYVFARAQGSWSQQAYIKATNTRASAQFGHSVALAGDTLVVGSYSESSDAVGVNGDAADPSMSYAGAAYVYRRRGVAWATASYLKASNTRGNALFGIQVAAAPDALAVGSSGESSEATGVNGDGSSSSASYAGAVYLYR